MTPQRHGSRGQEQQHGNGRRHPLEAWCQEQVEEKRAGHYRSCEYHLRARRSYATQREQDTHDHGRPPKDHGDKWHSVDHAFDVTVVRGGLDSSFELRKALLGALDIRVLVLSSRLLACLFARGWRCPMLGKIPTERFIHGGRITKHLCHIGF
jgi:hypothetical protein